LSKKSLGCGNRQHYQWGRYSSCAMGAPIRSARFRPRISHSTRQSTGGNELNAYMLCCGKFIRRAKDAEIFWGSERLSTTGGKPQVRHNLSQYGAQVHITNCMQHSGSAFFGSGQVKNPLLPFYGKTVCIDRYGR
jgi:hypothetical protein